MRQSRLLHGRYELAARIGQGGASAVFRARDVATGQAVAIKQIGATTPSERALVAREADLLARLSHRGLPSVVECFMERHDAFVVMTFVPGVDLAQRLSRRATGFP